MAFGDTGTLVVDLEEQRGSRWACPDREPNNGGPGARMIYHVGQRLAGDEVRGDLDRCGQRWHGSRRLNRNPQRRSIQPGRMLLDRGHESELVEDRSL